MRLCVNGMYWAVQMQLCSESVTLTNLCSHLLCGVLLSLKLRDPALFETGLPASVVAQQPTAPLSFLLLPHVLQGFAVGTESGALVLFEKESDEKLYKRMKTFGIEGQPHKIKSLALSSAEDLLLCALSNSQLFSLNMANTEVMKVS